MDILSDKVVITRKSHKCDACGRTFEKGSKMHLQVNTFDGIQSWRTCLTCQELLSIYSEYFIDSDDLFHENCVKEQLTQEQTPEDLLSEFTTKKNIIL